MHMAYVLKTDLHNAREPLVQYGFRCVILNEIVVSQLQNLRNRARD